MFRKSYLRDESSFFGLTEFNQHYHLPGEGNIRSFVGQGEPGSDAITAFSTEVFLRPPAFEKGYFEDRPVTLEIALFSDAGIFWNGQTSRKIADAGLGLRLKGRLFEKDLFLRVDFPFILVKDNEQITYQSWLISFQRGM